MNLEVARNNYEVLRTLPFDTKLRVEETNEGAKLTLEDRWFTSGRRYWEQTSKLVLKPITDTFLFMKDEHDVLDVLANTAEKLKKLYPDNTEINEMLQNISNSLVRSEAHTEAHTEADDAKAEATLVVAETAILPACILEEEAHVAPLRQRIVNLARYTVVSGDVVLDIGEENYVPNDDSECCLIKWFRDTFLSSNPKHD